MSVGEVVLTLVLMDTYMLLLVRLGGYIVNLYDFYFYKLIGKLTAFLQLQEFFNSRRVPPLLNQSLVLIPQQSV
jgi:hypothetical protein